MKGDIKSDVRGLTEVCAVCNKALGSHWAILGDKRIIHFGDVHGVSCFRIAAGLDGGGNDKEKETR